MFLLQKWISGLIYPFPLAITLMTIGLLLWWLTRKHGLARLLITFGFLLITLPGFAFVANGLISPLEQEFPAYGTPTFQAQYPEAGAARLPVVVLGGGLILGEELPPTARIPSIALQRLAEGYRIYRQLPGRQLIVSGGPTHPSTTEAQAMADIVEAFGASMLDVKLEANSRTTAEQAVELKKMLGEQPFFLVTSAWHMPRAVALLHKQGLKPIPCPGGHTGEMSDGYSVLPGIMTSMASQIAFHEYIGWLFAWIKGDV